MKDNFSKMRSFMAKNCPEKPSVEDLKKESEELYVKKLQDEARLLELYNQKKLTNKDTIRKARAIAQKYTDNK
jgi:hypothetical protein